MTAYSGSDNSPSNATYLLAGLGNHGKKYQNTRHNVGFMVVDYLAHEFGLTWQKKNRYAIASTKVDDAQVFLIKPMQYMNKSGFAVKECFLKHRILPEHLLVICDDLNLPIGRLRLRGQGSDGGHNGLASIVQELSTRSFARLKVGIGADFRQGEMSDYVLSGFGKAEKRILPEILATAASAALTFVRQGLDTAMNLYNPVVIEIA